MSPARLFAATVRLAAPVVASDRVHVTRTSLFLELDQGGVIGAGECATASAPGPDATATEVVGALDALAASGALERPVGDPAEELADAAPDPGSPAARAGRALVAAARLDVACRRAGLPLAAALGSDVDAVAFAGVLGVDEPATVARRAAELVALGATRLRVKHAPGRGTAAIEAALGAGVPVVVDANGALDPVRDRAELAAICALPIAWLEQPFSPDDLGAHAALSREGGVRVGLDESVTSVARAVEVAERAAATVVCVKPSRVGGVPAAMALHREATARGLAAYVGGFFEAGLGRATLGALAAAWSGSGAPDGDVVAPSTYLVEDPCHLAAPVGGRQPLHLAPGCGPHPSPASLQPLRRYDA